MRILVTGGAGFIGSHMTESLLSQGHEVYVMDNLFCGSEENFKRFRHNKNFWFKSFDVIDLAPHLEHFSTKFFTNSGPEHKFDQIYHMACPASPVTYQKDPINTAKTNFMGTLHMLEIAHRHKARFLITSTSEVYGDPLQHPQKEEYWGNVNCTGIRSCYDEGKRIAETLAFDFHRTKKVDIRVARIFNTYGPNMMIDDGRIISNFVAQALKGIPLTIYGNGHQTRSFCYVSDQIRGLQALMNQTQTIGPVNIGNPDEFTIQQVAELVKKIIGEEKVKIEYKELPSDDPKQRKPDITKAQKYLGWKPTVPLSEGLLHTIEDFKRRIHN